MAIRSTAEQLSEVVELDSGLSVARFIRMSADIIDYVESKDDDSTLTASHLLTLELLLAAHFYSLRDQQYGDKKTGDASGSFRGMDGMGFESTTYGQSAIASDITGCLSKLSQQQKFGAQKITVGWLGKPKSDQIDYVDRD